jgi:hypothetical protein
MRRLFVLALLTAAPSAWAEAISLSELESARSLGMGGAFRATGLGADSVLGNPAAMTMLKAYQLELQGDYDFPSKQGFGGLALRDSQTSEVAAGVVYDFVGLGNGPTRSFANLGTVGLALPLAEFLSIGAAGKYLFQWGAHHANAGTFDAGALVKPGGGLAIGISAHNLIDTRHSELGRYFAGSIAFLAPSFSIAADVRSTLKKADSAPVLNVGGEYFIGQVVYIRAGYEHDFLLVHNYLSGGAGVFFQGGGFDVTYRHEFAGDNSRLLAATIRLQM